MEGSISRGRVLDGHVIGYGPGPGAPATGALVRHQGHGFGSSDGGPGRWGHFLVSIVPNGTKKHRHGVGRRRVWGSGSLGVWESGGLGVWKQCCIFRTTWPFAIVFPQGQQPIYVFCKRAASSQQHGPLQRNNLRVFFCNRVPSPQLIQSSIANRQRPDPGMTTPRQLRARIPAPRQLRRMIRYHY